MDLMYMEILLENMEIDGSPYSNKLFIKLTSFCFFTRSSKYRIVDEKWRQRMMSKQASFSQNSYIKILKGEYKQRNK